MLMTALRNTLLAAAIAIAGCSTEDTIVALNISFDTVPESLDSLAVTITQSGRDTFTTKITPPTMPVDGGTAIKPSFYERLTLPDDWTDAAARVKVEAKSGSGQTLESAEVDTEIREEGTVAVFVKLGAASPDEGDEDAGVGD